VEPTGKTRKNDGLQDRISALKRRYPGAATIFMASRTHIREAVRAVRAGESNYIAYPVDPLEIRHVLDCIRERALIRSELDYLREEFWQSDAKEIVRTCNPAMKKIYEQIRSVAPTKTTVLLSGETGTGKGVLANLIHRHSNRDKGRFISVHCGAIPDTLLESELFGHEKGSFTGAFKRKLGKFEIAARGTLFLDEISTITPSAQIKLLQVLQDGTFSRVGGEDILKTDARFIAATNVDLKTMSDDGNFRKDLYYRLNVFPVEIPPLRERPEDIVLLADTFTMRFNLLLQKQIERVHPDVIAAMEAYNWPGNIRELENLIERAFILETGSELTPDRFPPELFNRSKKSAVLSIHTELPLAEARQRAVGEFENQFIRRLLAKNKGRINKSAEDAGISTRQFHKIMLKYQIRKDDFKT
jgi:DNA-binding NtrC family response regulator